jgi:hypothetical protein
VDTKRYKGKIKVAKPLLGSARLEIAGRDRTKLVDGLAKQVEAVAGLVAEIAPGTASTACSALSRASCRSSARPRSAASRSSIAARSRSA